MKKYEDAESEIVIYANDKYDLLQKAAERGLKVDFGVDIDEFEEGTENVVSFAQDKIALRRAIERLAKKRR